MTKVRRLVQDDQLLEAGALLLEVRRAQEGAGLPRPNEPLREGLDCDELLRRHSTCTEALLALTDDRGWEL